MTARKGSQEPRVAVEVPAASIAYSEGDDVVALSESQGTSPFPWQRHVLYDLAARDDCGRPVYTTAGLLVPRQNGKNLCLEVYELYVTAVCGWHVLHTAHQLRTASKSWQRLCKYFEDDDTHPEMSALVKRISRVNGEKGIFLKNGGSIEFTARSRGSNRGYDDIQLVVFDEAQELTSEQLEAVMYTLSASSTGERQMIFTGTPPTERTPGDVFENARKSARSDDPAPGTLWLEWSAEKRLPDDATWHDAVEAAYLANPSLGYLIQEGAVRDEFGSDTPVGFSVERLAWWPVHAAKQLHVISSDMWAASAVSEMDEKTLVRLRSKNARHTITAYGIKCAHDEKSYALCGARKDADGRVLVELIKTAETDGGTRDLAQWIAERRKTAACVVIDGAGTASALVDNLTHIPGVKLPKDFIVRASARDIVASSAGFLDGLKTHRIYHGDQKELEASALGVIERPIGRSGFGFGAIEGEHVTSTATEAAALAAWGARTTKRNPQRRQRVI